MKNFWLDKKKGGFPQDDEFSIMAGCCGNFACNLDIFYSSAFIQNEVLHVLDSSKRGVTVYICEYVLILPGTMSGKIAFEGCDAFTFYVSENGKVIFTRIEQEQFLPDGMTQEELDLKSLQEMAFSDLPIYTYYDSVYAGKLNLNTGEFILEWDGCETPVVTVCYEYKRL